MPEKKNDQLYEQGLLEYLTDNISGKRISFQIRWSGMDHEPWTEKDLDDLILAHAEHIEFLVKMKPTLGKKPPSNGIFQI